MSVAVRLAGAEDLELVRALFTEYATAPHDEMLFQSYLADQRFDREVAELPGSYAPPLGALLIAEHAGIAIGCVGLKPLEPPNVCEMKRLYVRPEGRGLGAGHALVDHVLRAAHDAGYQVMRLDTMPSMHDAQKLYRAIGFHEIPAYNANPVAGALFFEFTLAP